MVVKRNETISFHCLLESPLLVLREESVIEGDVLDVFLSELYLKIILCVQKVSFLFLEEKAPCCVRTFFLNRRDVVSCFELSREPKNPVTKIIRRIQLRSKGIETS